MNRIVVIIHMTWLLISCNPSNKRLPKTVFRYNSENGITSLDPAFASSQDNIWAVNQLFNGLIQLDKELKTQPAIAQSWVIDSSGKIYTFLLRNDVYFHENKCFKTAKRKVTANDFVYSFNRIIDPKTASPGAWIFNDKVVKNGFKALNDSTFQIELTQPFSPFIGILSMPYCAVVPHEAVEYYQKSFAQNPVGTGPFQLAFWEQDVNLILHKNEHYFETENGQKLPYLDAINISFIANKQMALLHFLQGNLDMFNGLSSSVKDVVLDKNGQLKPDIKEKCVLEKKPFLNTEYLAINIGENALEPLNNSYFRKAINFAIDREKMLKNLRNSIGIPAYGGFIPAGLSGHTEKQSYHYHFDLKKAQENLAKSGYLSSPKTITVATTKDYLDLCIYIQKQLKDIGINCTIDVLPSSELKEKKRNAELSFFRASWILDYPDAENYLSCFYSKNFCPSGPNYTHFKNELFDKTYEKSLAEVNEPKRIKLYEEMDKMILEESPVIILFYDQSMRLLSHSISNLENNPLNIPDLKRAKKKAN
ncbi:MAG: ABC transporter substrate-binding protein [Flavobacteriales bacterium]|nr:ABC transporter substrate-binding protein [Flavobacteriales bacterium]